LQVGEKKYKVHRYFLTRESEFFKDLFSLPQSGDSATVEGSDDNNPIKLPETPNEEIDNLLRFFYYGYVKRVIGSVPSTDHTLEH
jgi:hypothetical protein